MVTTQQCRDECGQLYGTCIQTAQDDHDRCVARCHEEPGGLDLECLEFCDDSHKHAEEPCHANYYHCVLSCPEEQPRNELDNTDPIATGTRAGAFTIASAPIILGETSYGVVNLRFSPLRGVKWAQVVQAEGGRIEATAWIARNSDATASTSSPLTYRPSTPIRSLRLSSPPPPTVSFTPGGDSHSVT